MKSPPRQLWPPQGYFFFLSKAWRDVSIKYQKLRKFYHMKWNFLYQITVASRTPDKGAPPAMTPTVVFFFLSKAWRDVSIKYQKLRKILPYEMKFLVPNYSCLQNPWLGGYRPQIPVSLSSVLNWICWTPPSPPKKIPGYATDARTEMLGLLIYILIYSTHNGVMTHLKEKD